MSARRERESTPTAIRWLPVPLALGPFIALKLAGVTDWSWWWVLSPLWIGVAAGVLALAGTLIFFALLTLRAWFQLRLRFRQAFPEVFIDPAKWSRASADRPEDH